MPWSTTPEEVGVSVFGKSSTLKGFSVAVKSTIGELGIFRLR
jgi:hypothetical protein